MPGGVGRVKIETRYVDGRECPECNWWHVPWPIVVGQPEPRTDDVGKCPRCGNDFMAYNRVMAFDPFATFKVSRTVPKFVLWRPSTWGPGPWRRVGGGE